ncbi:hypothetical protein Fleli_2699 [Bernardetia litoralis DSM 6794]|uniref:Lipoprotein n=1 Tax=Bernardetia litoralis (strain ATCC 23117 / DSM 6794 / NBRC 15988 / NCIMB 1366 / Fx l1 / Sio-4) TaxID=880071 RepID=I4AM70_BERLS|nr:hypothetical protein [Bernardetia litoralis]AFM05055.1 hypothetical protein Fleli_2699 [Bernardetia litoralis DSM 6794]
MKKILFLILSLTLFIGCVSNNGLKTIKNDLIDDTLNLNRVVLSYSDLILDKNDEESNIIVIDTFYRKQTLGLHVLFESMMLPQTGNQLNARGVGLWNGKLNVTECINSRVEGKKNKFLEISETDTTLNITWVVIDNCCFSFLGDFELVNDSTLNCIYHSYGEANCACNCEYKITYQLNKYFDIEGYEENYKSLKYVSLNNKLMMNIKKYKYLQNLKKQKKK